MLFPTRTRTVRRTNALSMESLERRRLFAADAFEPNDTLEAAAELFTGDHQLTDLTIDTTDDIDVFEWKSTADGQLNVDVLFSHQDGDLDMQIFNQQEHLLLHTDSLNDNETGAVQVTDGDTYYIRVFGYELGTNDYTLKIDGPGEIPKDSYEWNDLLVTASDLGAADQTIHNLSIHGEGPVDHSVDYFKWTAVDTGMATVSVDFKHVMGDIELQVLDAAGDPVGKSESGDDGESVTFPATRNETHYFKVYGHNFTTNPNYSLSIDGPDLPGDRFEPNDTAQTATTIADGTYSNLSIHAPGNDDWYSYTAALDGTLDIDLAFDVQDGDIELEVYAGQLRVAAATSAGDGESLSVPVTAGLEYSIRAFAHPFVTNKDYSMTIAGPQLQLPFIVDVIDVQPESRSQPVDEIEVTFDRPIVQLDLSNHVSLVRSNDVIEQVSLDSATVQSLGGNRWKVGNLAKLTSTSGIYDLTVGNLLSDIQDQSGNTLQNSDTTRWIQGAGDANLDGRFDSSDLVKVFVANQFEDGVAGNSRWSTGDWDGDGDFGTSDLLVAFQAGWYSSAAPARPQSTALSLDPTSGHDTQMPNADARPHAQRLPHRFDAALIDKALAQDFGSFSDDESLLFSRDR